MKVIQYSKSIDGYELTFQYDPKVVNIIKGRVDYMYREYRPQGKVWVIHRQSDFERLYNLLQAKGYTMRASRLGKVDTRDHTPKGWVPANQRDDYVDPLARENDPRRKHDSGPAQPERRYRPSRKDAPQEG